MPQHLWAEPLSQVWSAQHCTDNGNLSYHHELVFFVNVPFIVVASIIAHQFDVALTISYNN